MTVVKFPSGSSLPQRNPLVSTDPGLIIGSSATITGSRQLVDGIWYSYQEDIDDWISDEKETLIFNKVNGANGTFLRIGEVKGDDAKFLVLHKARIMRISARASSGLVDKVLDIYVDGVSKFNFNLSALTYTNSDISPVIDVETNETIQVFVRYDLNELINNVVVTLSLGWLL